MSYYKISALQQAIDELGLLTKEQFERLTQEADAHHQSIESYLIQKQIVSQKNMGQLLADISGYNFVHLADQSISKEVLNLIPEIVARKQRILAFKADKIGLHLAMENPADIEMREFLEKKTGLVITPYIAMAADIDEALWQYSKDIQQVFEAALNSSVTQAVRSTNPDNSIKTIVSTLIEYAYRNKASDIHIEPLQDEVIIRFRIDGMLHDVVRLPLELLDRIVSRIKVMAQLRIDEHQEPQDGKIGYDLDGFPLDLRVSIVPIVKGEKVVMRLLAENARNYSLSDLGLSKQALQAITKAAAKPTGMILVTGPTGSGKTTTLYALLKILNTSNVNVMTIEDPVEYDLERVNQIQVNPQTKLTFAKGLRSIVRQDPDVIMVGEIRDQETAAIAVNSAMTGHLVLSTLHTNDAATAIPRLLDMEIEPYLVASTVSVVVAQRLVRRICALCRVSVDSSDHRVPRMFEGKGCEVCNHSGYRGRVGIFEVLFVDEDIRAAITQQHDAQSIKKQAQAAGMITMFEDGLSKVATGLTTIEEVQRVAETQL